MKIIVEIKIGDEVIILDDLINNLEFKRYLVEDVYESSTKNSPYQFSYILQGVYGHKYRHEIFPVTTSPVLKIYISDGEYVTIKNFIEINEVYLKENNINISVGFKNGAAVLYVEFNFKKIVDFHHLSLELGRFLEADKKGIEERDELSRQSITKQLIEQGNFNKRQDRLQDSIHVVDDAHDTDGIRKDDDYNPENWQGHDD